MLDRTYINQIFQCNASAYAVPIAPLIYIYVNNVTTKTKNHPQTARTDRNLHIKSKPILRMEDSSGARTLTHCVLSVCVCTQDLFLRHRVRFVDILRRENIDAKCPGMGVRWRRTIWDGLVESNTKIRCECTKRDNTHRDLNCTAYGQVYRYGSKRYRRKDREYFSNAIANDICQTYTTRILNKLCNCVYCIPFKSTRTFSHKHTLAYFKIYTVIHDIVYQIKHTVDRDPDDICPPQPLQQVFIFTSAILTGWINPCTVKRTAHTKTPETQPQQHQYQ